MRGPGVIPAYPLGERMTGHIITFGRELLLAGCFLFLGVFLLAVDCREPYDPGCMPRLEQESDAIPREQWLRAARLFERGHKPGYVCSIVDKHPIHYREASDMVTTMHCGWGALGCYDPKTRAIVVKADYRWKDEVIRHELLHWLLCSGPGLCQREPSHSWMRQRGVPLVEPERYPKKF